MTSPAGGRVLTNSCDYKFKGGPSFRKRWIQDLPQQSLAPFSPPGIAPPRGLLLVGALQVVAPAVQAQVLPAGRSQRREPYSQCSGRSPSAQRSVPCGISLLVCLFVLPFCTVGVQNKSPQGVPLWYVDCFELKKFSVRLPRTFCPPLTT